MSSLQPVRGTTGHWGGLCSTFEPQTFLRRDWVPRSNLLSSDLVSRVTMVRGDVRDQDLSIEAVTHGALKDAFAILDNPRLDEFDLSSLDTVFYGAAAASPTRLKEAIDRFGKIFFQFYGQAECPMTITVLRKDEHDPDDLERLASDAAQRAGAVIDQRLPRGTVPAGEARNIHVGGGRYVSLLGGSPYFHNPMDLWPQSVALDDVVKYAAAMTP